MLVFISALLLSTALALPVNPQLRGELQEVSNAGAICDAVQQYSGYAASQFSGQPTFNDNIASWNVASVTSMASTREQGTHGPLACLSALPMTAYQVL
jgi:hypothetical protein